MRSPRASPRRETGRANLALRTTPWYFVNGMYFRLDQLGKNILREFFVLVGTAETEVEVPAGDAQRIDLWHVPNPELLRAHPEIEPGLLRAMAVEPGMVEVFSGAPDAAEFEACVRKRYQWHHTLELRAEGRVPVPTAWLVCAGRPDGVLQDFGFEPDAAGLVGLYAAAPGWRVRIVVVGELPRVRSTVLLRLLGAREVQRLAIQDLVALPEDAWERRLAVPWLEHLGARETPAGNAEPQIDDRRFVEESSVFEVPEGFLPELPAEERELIWEVCQYPKLFEGQWRAELLKLREQQPEYWRRLQVTARLFGRRLGRPLTELERRKLDGRFAGLGEERLD